MTAPTPDQMRALGDEWQQQLHDAAMTQSEKDKRERTVAALRAAADQLDAVRAEVIRYAGWHEDSLEGSWRFERDIRTALGMVQYSGDDDD